MKTIKLPDGTVTDVPDEVDSLEKALIYVRKNSGDEAYKSALNATQNQPAPLVDPPTRTGPFGKFGGQSEAAGLAAGRASSDLLRGAKNLTGLGEQTPQSTFEREAEQFAPVQAEYPLETFGGALAPYITPGMLGGSAVKAAGPAIAKLTGQTSRGLGTLAGTAGGATLGAIDPQSSALEGAVFGTLGSGPAEALQHIPSKEWMRWASRNTKKATQYIEDVVKKFNVPDLTTTSIQRGLDDLGPAYNAAREMPVQLPDSLLGIAADAERTAGKGAGKKILDFYNRGTVTAGDIKLFLGNLGKKGESRKQARGAIQSALYEAVPELKGIDAQWSLLKSLRKPGMVDGGKVNVNRLARELDTDYPRLAAYSDEQPFPVARAAMNDSSLFKKSPTLNYTIPSTYPLENMARNAPSIAAKGLNAAGRGAAPVAPGLAVGAAAQTGQTPEQGALDPALRAAQGIGQGVGQDFNTMRLMWDRFINDQFGTQR